MVRRDPKTLVDSRDMVLDSKDLVLVNKDSVLDNKDLAGDSRDLAEVSKVLALVSKVLVQDGIHKGGMGLWKGTLPEGTLRKASVVK